MRVFLTLLLVIFLSHKSFATYEEGQGYGESLISGAACHLKDEVMGGIQGYGSPYKTYDFDSLEREKKTLFQEGSLKENEDLKSVYDQGVKHKAHVVHANDPVIQNAYEALTDPEKFLTSEDHEREEVVEWEEKGCDEQAQEETTHTCRHELIKASKIKKDEKYWRTHYWGWDNGDFDTYKTNGPIDDYHHHHFDDCNHFWWNGENEFKYYQRTVSVGRSGEGESTEWEEISKEVYEAPTPLIEDAWAHNCSRYISGSAVWQCQKVGEKCLEGPLTKTRAEVEFTRPCWLKEDTYKCGYVSSNTCEPLRKRGCYEIGVRCKYKEFIGGREICRVWQKVMRCPKRTVQRRFSNKDQSLPHCVGTDCRGQESKKNQDFLKAISKLALLKQMQDDQEKSADHILSVFKGGQKTCTTSKYGYENCCKSSEGWMTTFGGRCKPEEKQLAKDRQNGLCVEVGKFCSRKIKTPFGSVCRQQKTSFCCFPSRIARIIHEQGRRQLAIQGARHLGWGDPESPNCRGFSVQDLSKINFERLDTRELFEALNAKKKLQSNTTVSHKLAERMSAMVDRLGNAPREEGV